MLNKYIEKRITDKITILNILLDIRSIELDELSTLTSLQSKSLLSILQELQETFEEELTFNLRYATSSINRTPFSSNELLLPSAL